jgi:hypothetical protein
VSLAPLWSLLRTCKTYARARHERNTISLPDMGHVEHIYVTVGPQLHTLTRYVKPMTSPFGSSVDTMSSRSREPIGECPREAMGEGSPRPFQPPRSDGGVQTGERSDNRSPSSPTSYVLTTKGRLYLWYVRLGVQQAEETADGWDDGDLSRLDSWG